VQNPESQETTDPTESNLDVVDTSRLNEYNRIANMLSKYSQEQFLNHILSETCSSETDLENTRAFLFEILRDSDTFPFDRNAELKRRKHTRFGESVPLKLAKDIHALISVAEGADYSELNDVLSNCKTKARSKSVSQSSAKITHTAKVCTTASDSDVKLLTEKVSCIEADMLLLKQRQIAIEVARRDEIKLLQQTVSETKSDIGKLQTVLQDQCNYLRDIFDKTLGQYSSGHMQQVELYMDKVYKTVTPLYLRVEALCEHVQYAPNSKTSSPVTMAKTRTEESSTARDPDAAQNMYPLIADYPPLVDTQTARDPSVNTHRHAVSSHSAKLQNLLVPDGRGKEGELTFGNIPIPTTISGQQKNAADATRAGERHPDQGKRIPTRVCGITESSHVQQQGTNPDKSSKTVTAEFPSYKDVAARQTQNQQMSFARIYREIGRPPRHGDRQDTHNVVGNPEPNKVDSEAGLFQHIKRRKRTKRYYIGGFLPSVTENEIASYVSERGPKVSKVTIFRNRKYNTATIRLNVYDNQDTSLLEEPYFWPSGVSCRPWVTHNQYQRNRSGKHTPEWGGRYNENQNYDEHDYNNGYMHPIVTDSQPYQVTLTNDYVNVCCVELNIKV